MLKVLCADYWKCNYAPRYYAWIMRAWVFIMRGITRNIMRRPHLLCATSCAAPATLQYIMRGLCAPVFYYARHYAQHYARTAHIIREMLVLHSASLAVYAACPSFFHTHHGTAEPANATNISCHSQVEARIILCIISRIISAHNVAHNNYSTVEMTSGYVRSK